MATIELTAESFGTAIASGIVLVDWSAGWCGPCRAFAPIYEAASVRHPSVVFGQVDTEAEPELAAAFEIRSIPTLMVFRDGILLLQHAGLVSGRVLDDLVAQALTLDMDDVRRTATA